MDPPEIKMILPDKRILHLGGFSIGVIHGWGSPKGLEERVFSSFDGEKLDAIIYGHSHIPANYVNSNILFFNPGSPTDTRFAKSNSIGILTLDTKISGEIIKF
jgi:hypothetical protein